MGVSNHGFSAATVARVLIVDDAPKLRESLAEGLRLEKWDVATACDGADALRQVTAEHFDLVVLDWMLPDMDGMEVLKRVRAEDPKLPVLIITARNSREDESVALANGATGFIRKPFSFADLAARCAATVAPVPERQPHVTYGATELDLRTGELRHRGAKTYLTEMEAALMEYLLRHPHDIATTDALAEHVLHGHALSSPFRAAVEYQMTRLIQKLEMSTGGRLIRAVRGIGYALE